MKTCILLGLIFISACSSKNTFQLENNNYLLETSSLKFSVDSNTNAYPETFFKKGELFLSVNNFNNSITIFDSSGKVVQYQNFNYLQITNPRFNLTSGWFQNLDSVFIYSDNLHKIYLLNSLGKILDSTNAEKKVLDSLHFYPMPEISSKQPPNVYGTDILTTGFLGGELKTLDINNRFIINRIKKDTILFYGRYPSDYDKVDWGGFYFRHVYNTEVVENKIYYSFPASSQIGIFDLRDQSFSFKTILPEIKPHIKSIPFKMEFKCINDKGFLPRHFYSQYSFGSLIYDKYRDLFYRFLLKPTNKESLEKDDVGPQPKFLITYNRNFEILGYNDLPWEYSNFNFFVSPAGLYIQKVKRNDENNMYFSLFTVNISYNK